MLSQGKFSQIPRASVKICAIIRMRQRKSQKSPQRSLGAGLLKFYYPPEWPEGEMQIPRAPIEAQIL